MKKDSLFLLKSDFEDIAQAGKRFICPESVFVQGLLGYYPRLMDLFEVIYVDFKRPRQEIVRLIGAENQSCPVLVLRNNPPAAIHDEIPVGHAGELYFISGQEDITTYLQLTQSVSHIH